ncbi:hypothetical protein DL771_002199 [Monosporascus sp. 5C6A]|nr:hypothetical protein DL771_002199 [Monosporascus sp. 5C6A]
MYGRSFSSVFVLAFICTGLSIGSPITRRQNPAVSQDLFDQFTRYTALSAAVYATRCPSPPFGVTITKRINNIGTNTQGFIARDDAAKEVILAFRGTSAIQDFVIDLSEDLVPFNTIGVTNCEGCMAHEGFLRAWNSVAQESIDGVKAELAANPGYKVTVTGHSLGGSLASLATLSMLGSGIDVTTFTFGQPRTGNQAYADFVDQQAPQGKMFRITHANDGVPQVMSTSDGYRHHSTEFWQKDAATAAGTFQCSSQEPQSSGPELELSMESIWPSVSATAVAAVWGHPVMACAPILCTLFMMASLSICAPRRRSRQVLLAHRSSESMLTPSILAAEVGFTTWPLAVTGLRLVQLSFSSFDWTRSSSPRNILLSRRTSSLQGRAPRASAPGIAFNRTYREATAMATSSGVTVASYISRVPQTIASMCSRISLPRYRRSPFGALRVKSTIADQHPHDILNHNADSALPDQIDKTIPAYLRELTGFRVSGHLIPVLLYGAL